MTTLKFTAEDARKISSEICNTELNEVLDLIKEEASKGMVRLVVKHELSNQTIHMLQSRDFHVSNMLSNFK